MEFNDIPNGFSWNFRKLMDFQDFGSAISAKRWGNSMEFDRMNVDLTNKDGVWRYLEQHRQAI